MKLVHELYFPLQASKDVAFEIGRIFMGLKDFDSAAELFRCVCVYCARRVTPTAFFIVSATAHFGRHGVFDNTDGDLLENAVSPSRGCLMARGSRDRWTFSTHRTDQIDNVPTS